MNVKTGRRGHEVVIDDARSVKDISQNYQATRLLTLKESPVIGPAFNYSPNDNSKISDAYVVH